MRTCKKCTIEKDDTDFYGDRTKCKDCMNEERRLAAEKKREKASETERACKACGQTKNGSEFYVTTNLCKPCYHEKTKDANNRPSESDPPKVCRQCNTLQIAINFRGNEATCKGCNKKKLYAWREANKEQFLGLCKKYRDKEESKEKRAEYRREKYNEDLSYRLESLYRNRVRLCIKKKHCPKNTSFDYEGLLGCSWNIAIQWLEFNMKPGMTWENYGTHWHVDHVLPCASFNFENETDRKRCFHWMNLMPLEGIENIKKSAKIIPGLDDNAKKRAIEFMKEHPDHLTGILTESLPEDIQYLVHSGVLATKDDVKASSGSGEIPEVE
jgi:hypothetical protein